MWRSSAISKPTTPPPPATPSSTFPKSNIRSFRRRPSDTVRSTLTEALEGDPFRSTQTLTHAAAHTESSSENDTIDQLNDDLRIFASIYPDVKFDLLRELLLRFDGESRLHICTEELVKHKGKWVNGRQLNPPRDDESGIPVDELFRYERYIVASRQTLAAEFKSLNRSTIEAVLTEVNFSYSKARPLLQGIAAKSWRAAVTSFFKRRKGLDDPPPFLIGKSKSGYRLLRTGDNELDQELDRIFYVDLRSQQQQAQQRKDAELASALNQEEAEEAKALFECQVCYNDVPFESIVTCTGNTHVICHDCVRHSLNEAIFGQGWAQSVDVEYGTLSCVAPDADEICNGHIPCSLLENIVLSTPSGRETWNKFENRLAIDNLMKSGLQTVQCPFCHYAEATQVHDVSARHPVDWRFRKHEASAILVLLFLLAELILPTILLVFAIASVVSPGLPRRLFNTSLINLYRLAQTQRFYCKNQACARTSCLSCSKAWHDPHTCNEPLIISLRTSVEAARTAALKRTCPRCGTSFIKSSGCNKLTCVCGYAMCYLCRKNIGKTNASGAVDDREGGEGYRHFCEHFRPIAGQKCVECNKCDLYMNEDEEVAVRKAGEEAERDWRQREGMVGVRGLGLEEAVGRSSIVEEGGVLAERWQRFTAGNWTVQQVCDWAVAKAVIVES